MPTYEYVCDACGHEMEEFQSITAKPLRKCPECGKSKLRRLIGTGSGVIFRGSGFYQTDYRSDGYKKAAEADKPKSDTKSDGGESKPSGDSAAKKTETKSEPKPAKSEKKSDAGKSR